MSRPICVVLVNGWLHVRPQRARTFVERVTNPCASLNRSAPGCRSFIVPCRLSDAQGEISTSADSVSIDERTLQPGRPALLRLSCIEARLRRLIRVLTLIRLEQVRAELRQCGKMYSLVRMLDLTCVQQVVENRRETAQLPEIGIVKFHVGFPVFSVSPEQPLSDPAEGLHAFTWEGRIRSVQVR